MLSLFTQFARLKTQPTRSGVWPMAENANSRAANGTATVTTCFIRILNSSRQWCQAVRVLLPVGPAGPPVRQPPRQGQKLKHVPPTEAAFLLTTDHVAGKFPAPLLCCQQPNNQPDKRTGVGQIVGRRHERREARVSNTNWRQLGINYACN